MNILDAKKRMYDEMEEYAGNEAAKRSGPLSEFQGKGVPVAHESVTVLAQPGKGQKLTPEQLREKVGKMGVLPVMDEFTKDIEANKDTEDEEMRRALQEAMDVRRATKG